MQQKITYQPNFIGNNLIPDLLKYSESKSESNEHIEPVHLQIVCNQLFETVRNRYDDKWLAGDTIIITENIYQELGGVKGILQHYVDYILAEYYSLEEQQDKVRSVLQQMVTSGSRVFKSAADIAKNLNLLEVDVEAIIQQLDRHYLIETIPEEEGQKRKYSITHDYLAQKINQWSSLEEQELKVVTELFERCLINWKIHQKNLIPRSQFGFLKKRKKELLEQYPEGKQLFKNSGQRYFWLNILTISHIILSLMLGAAMIPALIGYKKVVTDQVQISRQTSETFFNDGDLQLEALTRALNAGSILQNNLLLRLWKPDQQLQSQIRGTLWKAFYQTSEQNRLWHENSVNSASFSPDGKWIVTASWDKTPKLWNLEDKKLIPLKGHEDQVYSASFSPNGNYIVTASRDKTARLWNLQGELKKTLEGHEDQVYSASFSLNGNYIVTASADQTARLWNLQGELKKTLEGHEDQVYSASFSLNGNYIVTASRDKTARLWNLQGELKKTLEGHKDQVYSASFSLNGNYIVTASADQTARLWNLQGELKKTLEGT